MARKIREKRLGFAIGWGLIALVFVSVLLGGSSDMVQARKYKYPKPNYGKAIALCKKNQCTKNAALIRACAKRAKTGGVKNCRGAFKNSLASCAGNAQCKSVAKRAYKQCRRSAGGTYGVGNISKYTAGQARKCASCCQRSKGQSSCGYAFRGNPFYGAYKSYKRVFCPSPNPPGSPSAAFLDVSGRIRHGLARLVPWAVDGWTTD